MQSIQTRLAAGLLLPLIVLLFIQWIVIATSIRRLSEEYIIARMVHASDLLVAALDKQKNNKIDLNTSRIDPIYNQPFSGYYYVVYAGGQIFRSRSLWDESLPFSELQPGQSEVVRTLGPQSQLLLVLGSAYQKQDQIIKIFVAEDISTIEKDINQLLMNHSAISLVVLIILISLQVYLVRKSLQPLDRIRKDLNKLESGLIDALDENVPREIVTLVKELNLRLRALRQRLQRSRHATGNLAHALKTPLTLLMQLSKDDHVKTSPKLQKDLESYVATIQNIIQRELKRTRVAGTSVAAKQAKLKTELQALIKSLNTMYREKTLEINYDVSDQCPTVLEREDFHEMMGNLLDNACKWADKKIQIDINCDNDLRICIEDDGPGIPPEQTEAILLRGHRLDEQTEGHGLGLSIVKDIIDQYQGDIKMSHSESYGGLRVMIHIPRNKT